MAVSSAGLRPKSDCSGKAQKFSLVLFHIHKSLYMILDKSLILFIVTGNNNRKQLYK
jgi:hypothetical protein